MSKRTRRATPQKRAAARRRYRRLHWGDESSAELEADAARVTDGTVLVALGELHAVEYRTSKMGDDAIYRHEFPEGSAPVLCATEDGDLVIAGGKYTVTTRGIVG